jgi:hypothetical protein
MAQTQDLRSSGMLRSVEWYFCTDVSGQPIVPIFKMKMEKMGCTETSVQKYHTTLRNIPEERKSQFIICL